MVIQGMPRSLTRHALTALLQRQGFDACYDFLYLPLSYSNERAVGYAIINFTSESSAERFQRHFNGFSGPWPKGEDASATVALVKDECHQGLQANLERYRNSPVMHARVPDEYKPLYLCAGIRLTFPEPTEELPFPSKVPARVRNAWEARHAQTEADAIVAQMAVENTATLPGCSELSTGTRTPLSTGIRTPLVSFPPTPSEFGFPLLQDSAGSSWPSTPSEFEPFVGKVGNLPRWSTTVSSDLETEQVFEVSERQLVEAAQRRYLEALESQMAELRWKTSLIAEERRTMNCH